MVYSQDKPWSWVTVRWRYSRTVTISTTIVVSSLRTCLMQVREGSTTRGELTLKRTHWAWRLACISKTLYLHIELASMIVTVWAEEWSGQGCCHQIEVYRDLQLSNQRLIESSTGTGQGTFRIVSHQAMTSLIMILKSWKDISDKHKNCSCKV